MNNVDFENLAESPQFAEFTTLMMKLMGLAMALNSPDGVIREKFGAEGESPICRLMRRDEEGLRRCTSCDRRHHNMAVNSGKPQLYVCHAGFLDMAVPIFVQGRHIATLSSGQILQAPPDEENFEQFLRKVSWLDYPEKVLRDAYFDSPYIPRKKVKYIMQLLELFARELCDSLQKIKDLEAQLERDEFREAKEFVDKHFRNSSLSLTEVAGHAGFSPAHFSHAFKKSSGISLIRFIQARRISEAKKLMADKTRSITEICFDCGFNSLTSFNRVFRRIEHQSPSQYRGKLLERLPSGK